MAIDQGVLTQLASSNMDGQDPNAGSLDTKIALEFIQDNIAAFGGDPEKVRLIIHLKNIVSWSILRIGDPLRPGEDPQLSHLSRVAYRGLCSHWTILCSRLEAGQSRHKYSTQQAGRFSEERLWIRLLDLCMYSFYPVTF